VTPGTKFVPLGGVIGLIIGYILKFLLDSRFVFRKAA
jgi:putative flippase GtrA